MCYRFTVCGLVFWIQRASICLNISSYRGGYRNTLRIQDKQGREQIKKIKYPLQAVKSQDRTAVLYRLQELLRLEHNERGKEYKAGNITKAQWAGYLDLVFNPESDAIVNEILKYRFAMKNDKAWLITLNESFE